uniref:Uncharacterized protein LOC100370876 n=1 Tax=Saccoglossus kowalevskii TaxID=10224 RepID=A0ABM0MTB3_SACKO|nr:PREDICTED: uncharacterized protein LOC100370876 [Saccoglossus kowalevskii]
MIELGISNNLLTVTMDLLTSFPDKQTTDISLQFMKLASLPPSIAEYKDCERLNLRCNSFSTLPPEISHLKKLNELNLSENCIENIPMSLYKLTALTVLNMNGNEIIGKLQPDISKLVNLQKLDLSVNNIEEIPRTILNLCALQELDLHYNMLSTIPCEVGQLVHLTDLNLSQNQLTELPITLGNLKRLQSLRVSDNKLLSVSMEIGMLVELRTLDLSKNEIVEIPSSIGKLKSLKMLHIDRNKLTNLPIDIGKLKNLQEINMSMNKILDFPESIGGLVNLQFLNAKNNQLKCLPVSFVNLSKLREVNVSNNYIESLPRSIGKLKDLKYLDISHNHLESLPPSIEMLRELTSLKMMRNQIKVLPREIGYLSSLSTLVIDDNPIREPPMVICNEGILGLQKYWQKKDQELLKNVKPNSEKVSLKQNDLTYIPKSISQYTHIQQLDLSRNKLSYLPLEMCQLTQLENLDISNNNLIDLPGSFSDLKILNLSRNNLTEFPDNLENIQQIDISQNCLQNIHIGMNLSKLTHVNMRDTKLKNFPLQLCSASELYHLNLSCNNIEEIPPGICNLQRLAIIDVCENKIRSIPKEIGNMNRLKELHISNNKIGNIPEPLCKLRELTLLDIRNNNLKELPPQFGELHELQILQLSGNVFNEFPPAISKLTKLVKLYLSGNNMTSIPSTIGRLKSLEEMSIDGNIITELPAELLELQIIKLQLIENQQDTPLKDFVAELSRLKQNGSTVAISPRIINRNSKLNSICVTGIKTGVSSTDVCKNVCMKGQNAIKKMWDELDIETLRRLEEDTSDIDFANRDLQKLPGVIGRFAELKKLNLKSNHLDTLPEEVSNLTSLESLNLADNSFENYPSVLSHLENLVTLNLNHNKLTAMHISLVNIKELDASHNNLVAIPNTVSQASQLTNKINDDPSITLDLKSLKVLRLTHNKLTSIPSVDSLLELTVLDISDNKLQKIPKQIRILKNLKELYLSNNEIKTVPCEITHLTELHELDISNNELEHLPPEIDNMTNLQSLYIQRNRLMELPRTIVHIDNLKYIDASGNSSMREPPADVCDLGINKIIEYWNNKEKEKQQLVFTLQPCQDDTYIDLLDGFRLKVLNKSVVEKTRVTVTSSINVKPSVLEPYHQIASDTIEISPTHPPLKKPVVLLHTFPKDNTKQGYIYHSDDKGQHWEKLSTDQNNNVIKSDTRVFGMFVVISAPRRENFNVPAAGGTIVSSASEDISVTFARNSTRDNRNESITMQIHNTDPSLRAVNIAFESNITFSPLLHLNHEGEDETRFRSLTTILPIPSSSSNVTTKIHVYVKRCSQKWEDYTERKVSLSKGHVSIHSDFMPQRCLISKAPIHLARSEISKHVIHVDQEFIHPVTKVKFLLMQLKGRPYCMRLSVVKKEEITEKINHEIANGYYSYFDSVSSSEDVDMAIDESIRVEISDGFSFTNEKRTLRFHLDDDNFISLKVKPEKRVKNEAVGHIKIIRKQQKLEQLFFYLRYCSSTEPITELRFGIAELDQEAENETVEVQPTDLDRAINITVDNLMSDEWKHLARRELQITDPDIERIENRNPNQKREQIHQMLRMWRNRSGASATVGALIIALEEQKLKNISDEIRSKIEV